MNTKKKNSNGHISWRTAMSFQKYLNENGFGESSKLFGYSTHTLLNKLHGMNNTEFNV
jgi:hypothetical protein